MAVQKSKPTRSTRGMRRSHDSLKKKIKMLSIDNFTKEVHLRHHMTKKGFYKGKKLI
ncbi:MAG: 50S ribosomal protein L32 [Buchnera aphidicola (Periphyllus lyropictus)]|uniref:50S ribosomal protein L32 n=1 Tax=Buchnera aphidicola TaxID=9 RepID=UPI001EBA024C|nr:50S ribosomal protein L32 [Buchnera aphidicola]NIH16595.1 50S ribosomal protein L32 [Buchnera aphidicola (Periphyllus lyropictus)]USS94485.1 50S ribosomal protein L32 [Buchnera aphidicola (Periphyllus lyropictus)]